MPDSIDNTIKRFRQLPSAGNFFIKLGLFFFIVLFAPSGGRLLGPLVMLMFWIILSSENRTITFSTIILAGGLGLAVFIPLATIIQTPVVLIFGKGTVLTSVFHMLLEVLLIASVLAGLSLWPKSRLRYTASILDFVIIGLSLGVGLECGIGILYPEAAGHQGIAWGMLPQLPGIIGNVKSSVACSGPMVWGMVFGLIVGVSRYFIGPDFNSSWLKRGIVIAVALMFLFWIMGERVGYCIEPADGFWKVCHGIDLKGRLLAYMSGLLTLLVILAEWLLMQEHPQAAGLKDFGRAVRQAWQSEKNISCYERMTRMVKLQAKRSLQRELVLGEEVKALLGSKDKERMKQRISTVAMLLAKEGSWPK